MRKSIAYLFIALLAAAAVFILINRPPIVSEPLSVFENVRVAAQMMRMARQEPDASLAMPLPSIRVSQVADTWGEPRSGDRSHMGQDIFAASGTPVYSASVGYLLSTTSEATNRLGGNAVFIFGRGGRRYYYAHLSEFAHGLRHLQLVSTTTIIGYVGTTGNASGTPPHLHFGVYTRAGAIDPLPLLRDRETE